MAIYALFKKGTAGDAMFRPLNLVSGEWTALGNELGFERFRKAPCVLEIYRQDCFSLDIVKIQKDPELEY